MPNSLRISSWVIVKPTLASWSASLYRELGRNRSNEYSTLLRRNFDILKLVFMFLVRNSFLLEADMDQKI